MRLRHLRCVTKIVEGFNAEDIRALTLTALNFVQPPTVIFGG
ncbi:MAG: hypothetical protein P4M09_15415 [Devosia sp.]|nr:hypothetical protein [Devosia sp.]